MVNAEDLKLIQALEQACRDDLRDGDYRRKRSLEINFASRTSLTESINFDDVISCREFAYTMSHLGRIKIAAKGLLEDHAQKC